MILGKIHLDCPDETIKNNLAEVITEYLKLNKLAFVIIVNNEVKKHEADFIMRDSYLIYT